MRIVDVLGQYNGPPHLLIFLEDSLTFKMRTILPCTEYGRTMVPLRHFDFYDGYTDYYLDKNAIQVRTSHCE